MAAERNLMRDEFKFDMVYANPNLILGHSRWQIYATVISDEICVVVSTPQNWSVKKVLKCEEDDIVGFILLATDILCAVMDDLGVEYTVDQEHEIGHEGFAFNVVAKYCIYEEDLRGYLQA